MIAVSGVAAVAAVPGVGGGVRLVVPVLRVVSGCGTHRLVLSRASLVGGRSVDVMIAHESSSRADPASVYPMGV